MPKDIDSVKRAALYSRVSTEEQAIHGDSLDAQRVTLIEYAKKNGYTVAGYYTDEGVSARKRYSNRPEFMRMLRDVEQGKIDVILFVKLDRWFRNVADYYEVQRILDAHHVDWIATEEQYDTTTANGRFALNIKLAVAQDEADRTSERIRFVFQNITRQGRVVSGKPSIGYKIVNKRYVIDEAESEMVRDIYRHYLETRSAGQTAHYVLEKYNRSIGLKELKHILSNRIYLGEKNGIPDWCPPIIAPETFDRVQELRKIRAERYNGERSDRVYYFTGLCFCGVCGHRMTTYSTGKNQRYIYYRCPLHYQRRCEMSLNINQRDLEMWLMQHIEQVVDEYNIELSRRQITRPAPTKTDRAAIIKRVEKLKDLYLSDLLPREMYEVEYRKCMDRLEELKHSADRQPKPIDITQIYTALSGYADLSDSEKKHFWSLIVKKIVVTPEGDYDVMLFV